MEADKLDKKKKLLFNPKSGTIVCASYDDEKENLRTYSDNVGERGKKKFLETETTGEGEILINVDES